LTQATPRGTLYPPLSPPTRTGVWCVALVKAIPGRTVTGLILVDPRPRLYAREQAAAPSATATIAMQSKPSHRRDRAPPAWRAPVPDSES
jgi:hypothetical protein